MNSTALNSRRSLLKSIACGFGGLALTDIMQSSAEAKSHPLANRQPHFAPKAKRIIFLFMHGGPSQVDTFDYKPGIEKYDGSKIPVKVADNVDPSTAAGRVMKSPWKFQQYGESGKQVSSLFPNVAQHVDDLCFIHSMHTDGQSHGQAVMKIHTGDQTFVRPSVGAWLSYGLGTENQSLPSFVTVCPTQNHGGVRNYGSAFLPAIHQGTALGHSGIKAKDATVEYLKNSTFTRDLQRKQLEFLQDMNRSHLSRVGNDLRIEGAIESFELAFRMQQSVPNVLDLSRETEQTKSLYGIDNGKTSDFGTQCLMARRLAEAGVRFVQVSHSYKWDQHGNLKSGHEKNALEVDKPIAGLLTDLKQRGLLEDTIVWWSGEFGRTPVAQGKNGRDHNPQGFTTWLAGAGLKAGYSHGASDEFGYYAQTDKVHMHDLHATLLHLMGLDHKRLTYRYSGRDFRLTDVHGHLVKEILA